MQKLALLLSGAGLPAIDGWDRHIKRRMNGQTEARYTDAYRKEQAASIRRHSIAITITAV